MSTAPSPLPPEPPPRSDAPDPAPSDVARTLSRLARSEPELGCAELGRRLRAQLGPPERDEVPLALRWAAEIAAEGGYASPAQLAAALEAWLAGEMGRPREPEAPPRSRARAAARSAASLLLAAIGAALLARSLAAIGADALPAPAPELVLPLGARSAPVPLGPVSADGVVFSRERAERVLDWLGRASPSELSRAGLHRRAVSAIAAHRPFRTLAEVAALPGVGPSALRALAAASAPGQERDNAGE